jgi:hypothetical protein
VDAPVVAPSREARDGDDPDQLQVVACPTGGDD